MNQETGNFKSMLFGGFNRRDVIDYIEVLAAERNELQKENEHLLEQLELASETNLNNSTDDAASVGSDNAIQDELKEYRKKVDQILSDAKRELAEIKNKYDLVSSDLKINVTQATGDLASMGSQLESLLDMMSAASSKLTQLLLDIDEMNRNEESEGVAENI